MTACIPIPRSQGTCPDCPHHDPDTPWFWIQHDLLLPVISQLYHHTSNRLHSFSQPSGAKMQLTRTRVQILQIRCAPIFHSPNKGPPPCVWPHPVSSPGSGSGVGLTLRLATSIRITAKHGKQPSLGTDFFKCCQNTKTTKGPARLWWPWICGSCIGPLFLLFLVKRQSV